VNSVCTINLFDRGLTTPVQATGFWREGIERQPEVAIDWANITKVGRHYLGSVLQAVTSIIDPWKMEQLNRDAAVTTRTAANQLLINELGWSLEQAIETRMRLRTFQEDWDAPGMEGYDEL
jgi:hypothetical protein